MTTTAMNFTCLLIYYFITLSLLFGRLFAIPYSASLHPCMHCRLFFFFFYWAARRIPLGGAEPQATNSLAQKRCVRPVHLRDRGLCLSLGFSRKKKKHWHAEQRATQKKATSWEVGSSMGAVETLASLGSISLWFFPWHGIVASIFSCFSLGFLWGLLAQPLTSLLLSSHFPLCIGAERREVHIRRDGITDYFPSSLLHLREVRKVVALPSITFFSLLIFSYVLDFHAK
ncbi:hypothetical protein V8C40DRAFT_50423 [Trichoderma camerunense]